MSGTFIFTFDDGLSSVYDHAFPHLRERGIRGVSFVCGSLVGTPGYMTVDQLRELQDAGWDVCSHGYVHQKMDAMHIDEAVGNITANLEWMWEKGFAATRLFCFPWGRTTNAIGAVMPNYHAYARGVRLHANRLFEDFPPDRPEYLTAVHFDSEFDVMELETVFNLMEGDEFTMSYSHKVHPVEVNGLTTSLEQIDQVIAAAGRAETRITTFHDMIEAHRAH